MIEKFKKEHLDEVMNIWLHTNIEAHNFVPRTYWENAYDFVRQAILTADVRVFVEEQIIKGFIGVVDGYVAGLFVAKSYQEQGIGQQLINSCKRDYRSLKLDVYAKNESAVLFYEKNGFNKSDKKENEETKETEYTMIWCKQLEVEYLK